MSEFIHPKSVSPVNGVKVGAVSSSMDMICVAGVEFPHSSYTVHCLVTSITQLTTTSESMYVTLSKLQLSSTVYPLTASNSASVKVTKDSEYGKSGTSNSSQASIVGITGTLMVGFSVSTIVSVCT